MFAGVAKLLLARCWIGCAVEHAFAAISVRSGAPLQNDKRSTPLFVVDLLVHVVVYFLILGKIINEFVLI